LGKHHYIVYSCHYIKDFQVHSRILCCEEVKNVHVDHMVIVQHLKMLFERLCLNKEKVIKMITDAGGNVRKTIEKFGCFGLHCAGHAINLVC
jgi:hypothetical protein